MGYEVARHEVARHEVPRAVERRASSGTEAPARRARVPGSRLLADSRAMLQAGCPGMADVAGQLIELIGVRSHDGLLVAGTDHPVDLPALDGCDDVPGEARLWSDVRPGGGGVLRLRLTGWWHVLTPFDLVLDVATAEVRADGDGRAELGWVPLQLDEEETRRWLLT